MSELIKLEKSDEMLKEIKRKANRMFTLEDAIWSHECIAIMQLIDEELERRNTRTAAPRFTAEEREALRNVMDNAVTGANSEYRLNRQYIGNEKAKAILQVTSDDLITVRAMLTASEIADKGKG